MAEEMKSVEKSIELRMLILNTVLSDCLETEEYLQIVDANLNRSFEFAEVSEAILVQSNLKEVRTFLSSDSSDEEENPVILLAEGMNYLKLAFLFVEQQDFTDQQRLFLYKVP